MTTASAQQPRAAHTGSPEKPLSVPDAILQRRSLRSFKTDPIPQPVLDRLIELTLAAPSSWNFQPWRLVLVRDPGQKRAIADVAWGQRQLTDAPITFVFTVSIRGWEKTMDKIIGSAVESGVWSEQRAAYLRENAPNFQNALAENGREREYAVKDAMIAATHLALAAESLGLGTCFMNGWDEAGVKRALGVENDADVAIALVMPVGYAADRPPAPGRLSPSEVVFADRLA